ncbi:hypothetical protein RJ639_003232 [Escallonia herrerae]|uniref:Cystatin domain-containing protein n=1 Tax=Escallonia herrerae TaxID=1293975 RepID=A0AA89AW91_9ASTE|nr:hypothetical protein RJ639_003232 [Escallonia herrerae]
MAKDAETSKPKHLDPTLEYYLSSQANSDPPIRATVSQLNEAKLIWDSLKTRYSIPNRPRSYKLWFDASMTTQGGTSVMTYYTKLLGLWDELLTLSPLELCGCPKGTEKMNWYQDLQTYQLLMGLDDKYATLHTQIINMDPFPNIDRVYAIMQEESHRDITDRLLTAVNWEIQELGRYSVKEYNRKRNSGYGLKFMEVVEAETQVVFGIKYYLKISAATPTGAPKIFEAVEKCYRRLGIGLPGKGRRRGRGSPAMSQNAIGSSSGPLQASVAMTQNSNPFIGQRCLAPYDGELEFLSSIWDIPPSPIGLPDGLQTNAIKAGSVSLADGNTLCHVLYVPNLAVNLISVSCLATDANCFVVFSHDICALQDRTSKSLIGLGKMHRGVFVFQPLSIATVAAVSKSESYKLWHRRIGLPSCQPLIHLPTVSVVSPSLKTICDVCCRAKHTRTVFPGSTSRAMDIFGLIHCDI